uniref:Uncharacterized protein n=1 Tax=Pseudictyota dubia TaxID=2749911 RepID=A0A7R9W8L7_9STRA|eukprot:CAMPEP_0197449386 /NCGR_PEP_ID=MMETSP1175-20131217/21222_1 /TAXON_ID=1003142 /ORGANISM="Triceratium dubium, Strain CCMP147" /LENGTH=459 /DNA_ID=CAMNT_0042981495 /DNA_START=57 /DNA_END=1436 /DNA_ORIENTATION=-
MILHPTLRLSLSAAATVLVLTSAGHALKCPCVRYIPWNSLTVQEKRNAEDLGYTRTTWNYVDFQVNPAENVDFSSLEKNEQKAAKKLGYNVENWDCCINHYDYYDWDELEDDAPAHYGTLGWTGEMWDDGTAWPASEYKTWCSSASSKEERVCLSKSETDAAKALCHTSSTYRMESMEGLPFAAYTRPDHCPLMRRNMQALRGFNSSTTTVASTVSTQATAVAATTPMHTSTVTTWPTETSSVPTTPTIADTTASPMQTSSFTTVSPTMKTATTVISTTPSTQASTSGATNFPDCPCARYTPWDQLEKSIKDHARDIGYNKIQWNYEGGSRNSDLEDKLYEDLTNKERQFAKDLLGYDEATWNCCINHYAGYNWSNLNNQAQGALSDLGWTQKKWDSTSDIPQSEYKIWCHSVANSAEPLCLTAAEERASSQLCYTESSAREESLSGVPFKTYTKPGNC